MNLATSPVLAPPDTKTRTALAAPVEWRILWRGRIWREADQLGRHLAIIALLTSRDDFNDLDLGGIIDDEEPLSGAFLAVASDASPWKGHQRLMYAIAAFLAVEYEQDGSGDGVARAIAEVAEASAREILGALRFN